MPGFAKYGARLQGSFQNYTALASFTSEASLLAGGSDIQPFIPAGYLTAEGGASAGTALRLTASGVISSTGTPTMQWTVRLGTTVGDSDLTGVVVGISPAITLGNGITNKPWNLWLDFEVVTPGSGATACVLGCYGEVSSPGGGSSASGFASPFAYVLEPSAPDTATWTASVTGSSTLWVNISATCGTSSASNTLQLKRWELLAKN